MFRFLHAADLHLDSPLRHLDSYPGAPVEAIRGATRTALEKLVGLAIAERVRFLLIAGDVYDGDWQDVSTGLFFIAQMGRLRQHRIDVFLISGNHDAANVMTRGLPYPDNVYLFPTDKPGTRHLDDVHVAIHGQGYGEREEKRNLAVDYPPSQAGYLNIGLLHTALDGRENHAPYAPCTPAELAARNYDYWALGHIHKRESVNGERRPRVEFPGNLQGRHIREEGPKGCLLVHAHADGSIQTEFRPLDVLRWARLSVDCTGAADRPAVLDRVAGAFEDALQNCDGRPLAARVELTGPCAEHSSLLADLRRLTEEVRAKASACGGDRLWLEQVCVRTCREQHMDEPVTTDDALSEVADVLRELRSDPAELDALLAGDFQQLGRLLPSELMEGDDGVRPADRAWVAGLLDRVEAVLFDAGGSREGAQ